MPTFALAIRYGNRQEYAETRPNSTGASLLFILYDHLQRNYLGDYLVHYYGEELRSRRPADILCGVWNPERPGRRD